MQSLKTMLVISLALGSTWLAWQLAPSTSSTMLGTVAYAQSEASEQSADDGPTQAEIDEQLARIEEAMSREGEVREFEPSEPLPADMAIEMSSEL